jgi:hypothetical protein
MENLGNMPLVVPFIHYNGTSANQLIENLLAVSHALNNAYAALKSAAPNGRDYYPEPGRMEKAIAQHTARMRYLDTLQESVSAEIEAIDRIRN